MPDHPATDPAKPGSKLEAMQKLGRRGGIRDDDEPVKGPTQKADKKAGVKDTAKAVKKAKTVLKKATAKRPGPPIGSGVVGQPWKEQGVSKATYYRTLKGTKGK